MEKVLLSALFFLPPGVYLVLSRKRESLPWVLLNAAVFTFFFWLYRFYSQPLFLLYGVLFTVSVIASFRDFFHKNLLTAHIVLIAVACAGVRYFLDIPPLDSVLSVSCGFLALFLPYLFSGKKWLGIGDIPVFASFCLVVEPYGVPLLLLISSVSGILCYWIMKWSGRPDKKIPFVPFLTLALFVYIPFEYRIAALLFGR